MSVCVQRTQIEIFVFLMAIRIRFLCDAISFLPLESSPSTTTLPSASTAGGDVVSSSSGSLPPTLLCRCCGHSAVIIHSSESCFGDFEFNSMDDESGERRKASEIGLAEVSD